ncbi:MAG: tetratricopeptide repeat protein [Gammaproteobacteria bacterium]
MFTMLFWIILIFLTLLAGLFIFIPLRKINRRILSWGLLGFLGLSASAILFYVKSGSWTQLASYHQTIVARQEIQRFGGIQNITATLQRILANKPDSHGYYLLGKLYLKQGEYARALMAFDKANQLKPNQPEILQGYAEARYFLHRQ